MISSQNIDCFFCIWWVADMYYNQVLTEILTDSYLWSNCNSHQLSGEERCDGFLYRGKKKSSFPSHFRLISLFTFPWEGCKMGSITILITRPFFKKWIQMQTQVFRSQNIHITKTWKKHVHSGARRSISIGKLHAKSQSQRPCVHTEHRKKQRDTHIQFSGATKPGCF